MDSKKVMADAAFARARDEVAKRTLALLVGMPVRDHRAEARNVAGPQWREIEEMVDGFARVAPQFALITAIWQRSFGRPAGQIAVA
jgi:hypothetical protein